VTYTYTYNGGSVPSYISIDSQNIKVYTTEVSAAGDYTIMIAGTVDGVSSTGSISLEIRNVAGDIPCS
jgi:hypothetical protein